MNRILQILFLGYCCASCNAWQTFYSKTCTLHEEVSLAKNCKRLHLLEKDMSKSLHNLANFEEVEVLDLSDNKLIDLSKIFQNVRNPAAVSVLLLDGMDLKTLPPSINRFKNLKHISLASNPNLDLAQGIQQINQLPIVFLNLQHNKISELPENLSTLRSLESINLSFNALKSDFNYEILAMLPKLQTLWMANNELYRLPPAIGRLKQLRSLYIEHNNLTELPTEITQLRKLRIIHAGHNDFTRFPLEFTQIKGLILLHLNSCRIATLPDAFFNRPSTIKGIILDENPIPQSKKVQWKRKAHSFFLFSMD